MADRKKKPSASTAKFEIDRGECVVELALPADKVESLPDDPLKMPPPDTDREIRADFDRLEGATRAVVDPGLPSEALF